MINKEDAENLDKLLRLVKASKDYESCGISYNVKLGWSIVIFGNIGYVDDTMEAITYKKRRLGDVCLEAICKLVQKKLDG